MTNITISQFEKFHAKKVVRCIPRLTLQEVILSIVVAFVVTPFVFVTATIIPLMGIITAALVVGLTLVYLYSRRSLGAFVTVLVGAVTFTQITFATIQSVKSHLEVPLFILTALGIPVCFLYCIFISTRIWILRGGEQ
jgi:hypothetical protein